MTGNDLDHQLAASMRRAIVRHAAAHRTSVRSPRRIVATIVTVALIAGVAVAAVFIAVGTTGFPVLRGAPLAATPSPALTIEPVPTPSATPVQTPVPSAPPTTAPPSAPPTTEPPAEPEKLLVNGFDARQIYQDCVDLTANGFGDGAVVTRDTFKPDSVKSGPDVYTQEGIPESEWSSVASIYVQYHLGAPGSADEVSVVTLCTASGPKGDPIITFDRAFD